ncbi:MAG: hypothetical protein IPH16_19720 [Haliscomenobacter sp.]|nr:hypothetical protein [Haliscomenobacter sp.]
MTNVRKGEGSRPQEVFVLGQRLEEGQTLGITPIAVLRCREAGQPRSFVLVQPTAFPPRSVKAPNFRVFYGIRRRQTHPRNLDTPPPRLRNP